MSDHPRLSICIPTFNRALNLQAALEGAIAEVRTLPQGLVEILVSDNCSTDATPAVLDAFEARFPLRRVRNAENLGFDRNYLNCVEQARGTFIWIIGDDDVLLPGALARILAALDEGAEVCLCAALEVNSAQEPLEVRTWFRTPAPKPVQILDGAAALGDYLDSLQNMGGIFGFISVAVFRRERFLEGRASFLPGIRSGWVHVWGMLRYLQRPTLLHWIAEPLVRNVVDNDRWAQSDPYARLMHDLNGWIQIADAYFSEDPGLRAKFLAVVQRNHGEPMVRSLRLNSGNNLDRWRAARAGLLGVGFDPILVNAVDFGFEICWLEVPPPQRVDPEGLCLADLPLVTRGARHIAVLVLGGLEDLLSAAGFLDALRRDTQAEGIRLLCSAEMTPLLGAFDLQVIDQNRLMVDDAYLEEQQAALKAFEPELLVNLDRQRGLAGDLFTAAVGAVGTLGFENETPENRGDSTWRFLRSYYRRLLPAGAPGPELARVLGLPVRPDRLWPDQTAEEEAQAILDETGWDPAHTLVVLGNDGQALGEVRDELLQAHAAGWTALGLGNQGSFQGLEAALAPFGERGLNLGGALALGTLAGLLGRCGAYCAGDALSRQLADAAGCRPMGDPAQPAPR